jgi:hypothetical protein
MAAIFWMLTLLGCVVGGFFLFSSFVEKGAPQQAAAAAIAVGFAVIPYCFARAVSELSAMRKAERFADQEPVDQPGTVQCPSCGKCVKPRPSETTCYLCGGSLAVAPRPGGGA